MVKDVDDLNYNFYHTNIYLVLTKVTMQLDLCQTTLSQSYRLYLTRFFGKDAPPFKLLFPRNIGMQCVHKTSISSQSGVMSDKTWREHQPVQALVQASFEKRKIKHS